ncbi:hypothetical protein ACEPAH_5635 [Sanghuangporus vaninii]
MDLDIKCNNLSCRKTLIDKAVVVSIEMFATCSSHSRDSNYSLGSHIFCVECANELFTSAQLCPACETHLSEPDDVVVCTSRLCIHPTIIRRRYYLALPRLSFLRSVEGLSRSGNIKPIKNSMEGFVQSYGSGLSRGISSFQQAVLKNMNERNAQLQKQLDNVIREANGELSLLNNKLQSLERELEIERRKMREMQDAARERDKEYQKLKNHYDKIKRKALLAPNSLANDGFAMPGPASSENQMNMERPMNKGRNMFANPGGINAVVGGMEANGIQRTPLRSGMGGIGVHQNDWQPLNRHDGATFRAPSASDQSADEVENILSTSRQVNRQFMPRPANNTGQFHGRMMSAQSAPMQQNTRRIKTFRPAITR